MDPSVINRDRRAAVQTLVEDSTINRPGAAFAQALPEGADIGQAPSKNMLKYLFLKLLQTRPLC